MTFSIKIWWSVVYYYSSTRLCLAVCTHDHIHTLLSSTHATCFPFPIVPMTSIHVEHNFDDPH